jgi:NAD(P)-dependent dehydrogenase (short-subunit alcohol dehydrogenase family)
MESLSDVIKFGGELNSSLPRLDVLYLIAGVGVAPYRLSKDGLSVHWSVNHLAHLVLINQLLPKLKETSEKKQNSSDDVEKFSTRIVTESSELHRSVTSDCKIESLEEVNADRDANQLYSRSKLYG